jgi:hypothetical protein
VSRPRGATPNWQPTRPRQIAILADLVARYCQHRDEGTLARGPRGIFYDLRPSGMGNGISYFKPTKAYPVKCFDKNTEAHPAAVQEVLVLARRAGIIPEHWVADTRAPAPEVPIAFDDAEDFAANVGEWIKGFRLDQQWGQDCYVEVLCEAEELIGRLARVAGKYGVTVFSGAGFDGLKPKRAFADRAMARAVPTIVLQFGDFDHAGGWIFSSAAEDAIAWAGHGSIERRDLSPHGIAQAASEAVGPGLHFFRAALTETQAVEHNLLDEDGKAEVDGLPVPALDALLTSTLDELGDSACRDELHALEIEEQGKIPDAIREWLGGVS